MSAVPAQINIQRSAIDGAVLIPYNLLAPSKTNPRKHFDPKTLAELAESVKKHGVLQPILVRDIEGAKVGQPLYEVVAGERRWRASGLAKLEFVPAIVRTMSDFEVLELQVIENLQRDDLHPLEEAEGYQALMQLHKGLHYANVDELAARIGKSRSYVFGRMKLCALIEPAKKAFLDGQIVASTALLIARMPAAVQVDATKKILQGWGGEPASYRQARELLEREFMLKLGSAPFKITDASLVPAAGSCKDCPKRSGANPDLFDDIKSGDVCTDPPCFAAKKGAHQARLIAAAKEEGREVLTGAAARSDKYVALEDAGYRLGHNIAAGHDKNIGQLLGKNKPAIALLEDPHTKELIEVVRRDEAIKVLKDKGIIKPPATQRRNPAEEKREAAVKADNAWRAVVAERAVAAIVSSQYDDVDVHAWLMPEAACAMWCRLESDVEKRAEKLLGWEHIDVGYNGDGPGVAKIEERVGKLTAAQLDQMLIAMSIAAQLHTSGWNTPKPPQRLLRVAKGLGINVDQVKAELRAAVKAKAAKKPVAKKAGAKPAAAKKKAAS